MKYWFVNLGKYYKEQRKGNFLWAPLYDKNKRKVYHWETMQEVKKGDIIFCNNNSQIVSIVIARDKAYLCDIPDEFNDTWKKEGRRIDADFIDLDKPLKFKEHKNYILKNIDKSENPFDINVNPKQGYLFPLDKKIAEYFKDRIDNKELDEYIDDVNYLNFEFEEEQEQFKKINDGLIKCYSDDEIKAKEKEDKNYHFEPNKNKKSQSNRVSTEPRLKVTRLEKAKFMCEIDNDHKTFINASGNNQYMECHHIIPMKAQKDFKRLKLDSMFNLISVCPTCHRKIHYANNEGKLEIFMKMFETRKEEMLKKGFDINNIIEIFNKYYKKKSKYLK